MCGVCGVIGRPGTDVTAVLGRLTSGLSHRGPDGDGFCYFAGRSAGLGHRRLSIVDLTNGAQPMSNEDGTVWVSYNGEIYNHTEIRRELQAKGHHFKTAADTEVVVHGWEEWGPAVLNRLNGIYALALYDGRQGTGTVWLARDPVGVKPLYVGRGPDGWWFSSELSAAREAGLIDTTFREAAIDEFLVYRFVPSPGTFYRNTWKIPPSHFCRLDLDHLPAEPEFIRSRASFSPATIPTSEAGWEEAIREGLSSAVRRQLMSDVPVGTLLSGGVDSSVVTKIMGDDLATAPQAFAVGVCGADETNELLPARRAADALGVPLSETQVTEAEYLAAWPHQVVAMGEPVANSGTLLLGMLCHTVGKTHKVVLTGQGADEPLGGYPRHAGERWYNLARRAGFLLDTIPAGLASSDRVERMRRLVRYPEPARRFAEILSVFSPDHVAAITGHHIDPDAFADPVRRWLPEDDQGDSLNSLLAVDTRLSLADDLLLVADHTSMASSVELRVPFLDLAFLARLESMPSRYKISQFGERKWLYRRAVTPMLPLALRQPLTGLGGRVGRKLGFTTPVDQWLSRWAHRKGEHYLAGKNACLPHHLDRDAVCGILQESRSGRPRARQLLSLYVLETWLRGASGTSLEGGIPAEGDA
ncbi:MAG: asparagine synthase (glutamine-hydrolyzing) [Gemmatimonadota bacterium]